MGVHSDQGYWPQTAQVKYKEQQFSCQCFIFYVKKFTTRNNDKHRIGASVLGTPVEYFRQIPIHVFSINRCNIQTSNLLNLWQKQHKHTADAFSLHFFLIFFTVKYSTLLLCRIPYKNYNMYVCVYCPSFFPQPHFGLRKKVAMDVTTRQHEHDVEI